MEAFRTRKDPGPWTGEKGKRVLTAAIGAGGVDGMIDRDPNKKGALHTVEAVIGGLAANRLANGPRSRSRSRGRGGGGSGLKDLAAGGLAAAAGKAFLDNRNRSKSRTRRRSYSSDYSDDSRSPPRRRPQNRSRRSKSLVGYVDKGLAALGLGESKNDRDDDRDRQGSRRSGGYDDGSSQPKGMPREEVARMRGGGGERRGGSSSSSSSSDEDMSSGEEDRRCKKMRGKEFLTAGLATVATIHAGHELYESVEKAKKRHKEVRQGTMSAQEARKLKSKALFQDAASVGIAALGIKGAMSEWKEMKESRDECHEFVKKTQERKKQRSQKGSSNGSSNGRPGYGGSQPSYRNSAPNLYAGYQNGNSNRYGGGGPMYQDGNPYGAAALPPPPMGAPPARY